MQDVYKNDIYIHVLFKLTTLGMDKISVYNLNFEANQPYPLPVRRHNKDAHLSLDSSNIVVGKAPGHVQTKIEGAVIFWHHFFSRADRIKKKRKKNSKIFLALPIGAVQTLQKIRTQTKKDWQSTYLPYIFT